MKSIMRYHGNDHRCKNVEIKNQLECGPMPNVMVALPNIVAPSVQRRSLADAHYYSAVQ